MSILIGDSSIANSNNIFTSVPFYYKNWWITLNWVILIIIFTVLGYQTNYAFNNPSKISPIPLIICFLLSLLLIIINIITIYNSKYFDISLVICPK